MTLTITLGDIVSIAVFVLSAMAVYSRLAERLAVLETKVNDLWDRRIKARIES